MNNFPLHQPSADSLLSGVMNSSPGQFDSQLNYVTSQPLLPESSLFFDDFSSNNTLLTDSSSLYNAGSMYVYNQDTTLGTTVVYNTEATVSDSPTVAYTTQAAGGIVCNPGPSVAYTKGLPVVDNTITGTTSGTTQATVVYTAGISYASDTQTARALGPGGDDAVSRTQDEAKPRASPVDGNLVATSTKEGKSTGDVREKAAAAEEQDQDPVIDISINNVVCSFHTRVHLNLRNIALKGMNVEFKRATGMVSMKLRKPSVTASIWASGKITCTGSRSEEEAKVAARKVARCLWRIGFKVKFTDFTVVNVLGTCSLPFGIRIFEFSRAYPKFASYEPELHPGVTYKIASPKATLKVFSTGSITVTAPRISNVQRAIEHIYPLVEKFRMPKAKAETLEPPVPQSLGHYGSLKRSRLATANHHHRKRMRYENGDSDEDCSDDPEDEDDELLYY